MEKILSLIFNKIPIFKKLDIKLIKFFFVAGINTLFGYCIFAFLLYCGLHYSIAGFVATVLGILFNFKTYGSLVFKNKNNKLLFRFLLVYAIMYCVGVSSLWLFSLIRINAYIGSAIMMIPSGLLGYLLNKKLVFKT